MNEIVNKSLLSGDKFMPEIHLKQILIVIVDHFLKTKIKFKNLKKQEIQDIYTETS